MSDKRHYPDGAYNDPRAPYNQPDYSDAIADYQWETYCERIRDEPDAWISEGITQQANERAKTLYQRLQRQILVEHPAEQDNIILGGLVRELVRMYATPSEEDALERIQNGGEE